MSSLGKKLSVLSASAALFCGLSAFAVPAEADTPGCVSKHEFGLVKKRWTKTRVVKLFDTAGDLTYQGYGYMTREYRVCTSDWGWATVDYRKYDGAWRVQAKSAFWK